MATNLTQLMLAAAMEGYAILVGVVLLVAIMLRLTYRKQRAQGPSPGTFAREHLAKIKEEHGMKGDIEELMVQLQELSRDIGAQIDTRFAKLEASIQSADERIETLQKLIRTAQAKPAIDLMADDDVKPQPIQPQPPKPAAVDVLRSRILALADAGKDPIEIAMEIGRTPGEIELILSLERSSEAGSA